MDIQINEQHIENVRKSLSDRGKNPVNFDAGMNIDIDKDEIKINFEVEEISIDSLNFKAINSGLGFHQDKKNNLKAPARKNLAQETTGSTRRRTLTPPIPTNIPSSGLSAQTPVEKKITVNQAKEQEAGIYWQVAAWLVDMLIISSLFSLTTALFFVVSGINFDYFATFILNREFFVFSAGLFIMYYLLYFTILDLIGSPGKNLVGIRLIRNDGGRLHFRHTFVRSIITILSSAVLFFPLLMDFQGKLTDTKIVR